MKQSFKTFCSVCFILLATLTLMPQTLMAQTLIAQTQAAEPLVNVEWVHDKIGKPGYVLLDMRVNTNEYKVGHIAGAVNSHYDKDGWRVTKNGVPGMLPGVPALEKLIGGLGIGNDDHIILLVSGYSAGEMAIATRVYWTFKVLGHEAVSILNGGMVVYAMKYKLKFKTGMETRPVKKFTAHFRPEMIATAEDVRAVLGSNLLIDHRPPGEYYGATKSGSVIKPGTLPGAVNHPSSNATRYNSGIFQTKGLLARSYTVNKIPTRGKTINFCNTGHWASLGWFVTHELLGNKETRLYDGSMADWTRTDSNPVVRGGQ